MINFRIGPFWFHQQEQWDLGTWPRLCCHFKTANRCRRLFSIGNKGRARSAALVNRAFWILALHFSATEKFLVKNGNYSAWTSGLAMMDWWLSLDDEHDPTDDQPWLFGG